MLNPIRWWMALLVVTAAGCGGGSSGVRRVDGGGCTMLCNLVCVDTMTDPMNCGMCGVTCDLGKICKAGVCALNRCTKDDECADMFNCTIDTCLDGVCRHAVGPNMGKTACPGGQFCVLTKGCIMGKACANAGDCADMDACTANERCDGAQSICIYEVLDKDRDGHAPLVCGGDDCDDANADRFPGHGETCDGEDNNCDGSVDEMATCADPLTACNMGKCGCKPENLCGNLCTDKSKDNRNCGACGNVCKAVERCAGGKCTCDTMCNNVCVDLKTNTLHCGACGRACAPGELCTNGACMLNPLCANRFTDNQETDVDCGGPNCGPCIDGKRCLVDGDCQSMACANNRCAPISCNNGGKDGSETDIDCGGLCPQCGTGKACMVAADCAKGANGQAAQCLTNALQGNWPGGYCSSACSNAHDQMDGSNSDCPGVVAQGLNVACARSLCMAPCGSKNDCRINYVCGYFGGPVSSCIPKSLSECEPLNNMGCLQGDVCVSYSPDDSYGGCAPGCDVFKQGCGGGDGCYAIANLGGKGACIGSINPNGDGQACSFANDCSPGFQCFGGKAPVCRPFCGGANNVACNNGKLCVDVSARIKKAVAGLCGG